MANYENTSTFEVQRLAKQGDKDALYEMAWRMELMPATIERDNPVERCAWQDFWFEKAADAGHVEAKSRYARSLVTREFNVENRKKTMRYFQSLSDDFDAGRLSNDDVTDGIIAKLWLGIILCEGIGKLNATDTLKGVKLLKEAEKLTNGFKPFGFDMMFKIGELYATGLTQPDGIPTITDLEQAIKYLQSAIERFDPEKGTLKKLDLAKQLLELTKNIANKKDTKSLVEEFNRYYSSAAERQSKLYELSEEARKRMEADIIALVRLRQRLAQEGW